MEAFAIIAVLVVALAVFVSSWWATVNQPPRPLVEQLDELEAYRDTLQKTALRGQLERWDSSMMEQIDGKLDEVERRIAETTVAR